MPTCTLGVLGLPLSRWLERCKLGKFLKRQAFKQVIVALEVYSHVTLSIQTLQTLDERASSFLLTLLNESHTHTCFSCLVGVSWTWMGLKCAYQSLVKIVNGLYYWKAGGAEGKKTNKNTNKIQVLNMLELTHTPSDCQLMVSDSYEALPNKHVTNWHTKNDINHKWLS